MSSGAMFALMPRLKVANANILLILGPAILLSTFILKDFSISVLLLVYLLYLIILGRRAHGEYIKAFKIEKELESRRQELEISNKIDPDLIARFGGEEFAVLLSYTSLKDACEMAEFIRTAIEKQLIQFEDTEIQVTASIGVSCLLPNTQTNPNQLIDSADKALYLAKDEGRNCVRCSDATNRISV
jgi:hypothetical protein